MGVVHLTLVVSGSTRKRYGFKDLDTPICIGRTEDCDVQIENFGISRSHCEIVREGSVYVLHDLDSRNGTFVNGSMVKTHNLNSGDVISFGKYSLEFRTDTVTLSQRTNVPSREGKGDEGTQEVDHLHMIRMQGGKASRIRGFLTVKHKAGDRTYPLKKPVFTFGRGEGTDLRLTGWSTPRLVAMIVRDETGFRILDVSPRGDAVRLNGALRRDARLSDHDEILLCGKTIHFQRGNRSAAPTTSFHKGSIPNLKPRKWSLD